MKALHIDLHMLNMYSLSQSHYSEQRQMALSANNRLHTSCMFEIDQNIINGVNINLMCLNSYLNINCIQLAK